MLMDFFDRKSLCMSINAVVAVAYGSAVIAANLLDYDICNKKNEPSVVIPRNTPIPIIKHCIYQTLCNNQVTCLVCVYQGESNKADENIFLGDFRLHGIPPGPVGQQDVIVYFSIDANGVLNVSAEVESVGYKKGISIAESGNLSKDDTEKMLKRPSTEVYHKN